MQSPYPGPDPANLPLSIGAVVAVFLFLFWIHRRAKRDGLGPRK